MTPDEIERQLSAVSLGAPPSVRQRVLDAIHDELAAGSDAALPEQEDSTRRPQRLSSRSVTAAAALLLIAVVLNMATGAWDRRLIAEFVGTRDLPHAARMFERDVHLTTRDSAWVPGYLQRFGEL